MQRIVQRHVCLEVIVREVNVNNRCILTQGALLASALVLIQQTEATCPKVKDFRQLYTKVVADKHEDSIAKFGAILAQGMECAKIIILSKIVLCIFYQIVLS